MVSKNPRQEIARLLREEMGHHLRWFYVSVANAKFLGGAYLKARGPTEAWTLLHRLGLFPEGAGAETLTVEVPAEDQARVEAAADKHYRLLGREEIEL